LWCALLAQACMRPSALPERAGRHHAASADIAQRTLTLDQARAALWPRERTIPFRPSTVDERETVAELLSALLADAVPSDPRPGQRPLADRPDSAVARRWAGAARRIGFELQLWRVDGQRYWALLEAAGRRRGAGAYIVRIAAGTSAAPRVVLQAPHAYFDLGSNRLALHMFFADNPRVAALFTNTVHRYWSPDGEFSRRPQAPADLCHRSDHVFQHATDAAARAIRPLVVMQLHGFADTDTRPDAIVSAGGTERSPAFIAELARALRPELGDVRRFPEQTDQLGGTSNAQARLLRTTPHGHFVHLELSSRVRRRLRANPARIARVARILFGPALDSVTAGLADSDD
jgi:hypothetical protein